MAREDFRVFGVFRGSYSVCSGPQVRGNVCWCLACRAVGLRRRMGFGVLLPLIPIIFGLVQMFARWELFKFFKMFRAQRLRNHVLFSEPFAQVDELATFGTKRSVRRREPIAALFARGTLDCFRHAHLCSSVSIVNVKRKESQDVECQRREAPNSMLQAPEKHQTKVVEGRGLESRAESRWPRSEDSYALASRAEFRFRCLPCLPWSPTLAIIRADSRARARRVCQPGYARRRGDRSGRFCR